MPLVTGIVVEVAQTFVNNQTGLKIHKSTWLVEQLEPTAHALEAEQDSGEVPVQDRASHSQLLERGLCLVLCGSVRPRLSERPSRRAVVSGDTTLFLQTNASLNMFC